VRTIRLLPILFCAALRASFASAATPSCDLDGTVVLHGPRTSGVVALTFDACPTTHVPGFSPESVATLQQARVPATFFVSGRWAQAHPDELAQLAADPLFEIAMHGHRHRHLHGASVEAIQREISDGRDALAALGEIPAPYFRPPYGEHPKALDAAAASAGVTPILWDVAPGDPEPKLTAAALERAVLRNVHGGSIIVLHVNGRGVSTGAALPKLLAAIPERGLRFVKVSELVRTCSTTPPSQ
jgi:peptidoglycan/xylan/chitin deacetylase (PgdA/CDA1 family)